MQKKMQNEKYPIPWDVVLFCALYTILPSYFAIEISEKLPLITASRGLLMLMVLMLLVRRRSDVFNLRKNGLRQLNLGLCASPVLRWGLLIYFGLQLVINLTFLTETTESIKAIFSLVAEGYMLVWALTLLIDTREKLMACLRVLVYASGATGAIAILSSIVDYNLFYLLNTVEREMMMANFYRLGMLRAEAGFGHAVYYGAYCAVMIPLNMYFVEESRKKSHTLVFCTCLVLNLVGMVLSNSRGSLLALGCTLVVMLPFKMFMKLGKRVWLRYAGVVAGTVAALVLAAAMSPLGMTFLEEIAQSMIAIVAPEQTTQVEQTEATEEGGQTETILGAAGTDSATTEGTAGENSDAVTDSAATEGTAGENSGAVTEETTGETVVDYGSNANGVRSRLIQLTGIKWTLERRPVFGFGPNAHVRGLVSYQYDQIWGRWSVTDTFDMEIVAVVCQYGIVGFVAICFLYGAIIFVLLRKKYLMDKLNLTFGFVFISYYLCMFSVVSVDKLTWIMIAMLVCFVNILKKEECDVPSAAEPETDGGR